MQDSNAMYYNCIATPWIILSLFRFFGQAETDNDAHGQLLPKATMLLQWPWLHVFQKQEGWMWLIILLKKFRGIFTFLNWKLSCSMILTLIWNSAGQLEVTMWIRVWADGLHRADTFQSNRPQIHFVSPYNKLQWKLQATGANPQFKGCHVPLRVDETIKGVRRHTTHLELWTGSSCRRHPLQYITRWKKVYTNTWLRHPVAVGTDSSLHEFSVCARTQWPSRQIFFL